MKCTARTRDGFECGAEALQEDPFCFFHSDDPEIAEKRVDARSRGGKGANAPRGIPGVNFDVSDPDSILRTLQAIGRAVVEGRADRSTGNSLGYLAKTAAETIKLAQLDARVKRIERKLGLREESEHAK